MVGMKRFMVGTAAAGLLIASLLAVMTVGGVKGNQSGDPGAFSADPTSGGLIIAEESGSNGDAGSSGNGDGSDASGVSSDEEGDTESSDEEGPRHSEGDQAFALDADQGSKIATQAQVLLGEMEDIDSDGQVLYRRGRGGGYDKYRVFDNCVKVFSRYYSEVAAWNFCSCIVWTNMDGRTCAQLYLEGREKPGTI